MRIPSALLLLITATTTLADGPVCIEAILSTTTYQAALTAHGGACPSATPGAYYLAPNGAGCCPSSLSVKTVGSLGAACCSCGALCTVYFPTMQNWNENGGQSIAPPCTNVVEYFLEEWDADLL